jgi:hypothetical protein
MLDIFKDVNKQRLELEKLLTKIQMNEIIYRQKNEINLANRFKLLEKQVRMSKKNLDDSMELNKDHRK